MDNFSPQQPDEGYSEDPLNPSLSSYGMAMTGPPSLADLPDWLTRELPRMPLSLKKSKFDDFPVSLAHIISRNFSRLAQHRLVL